MNRNILILAGICAPLLLLAGCGGAPQQAAPAEDQSGGAHGGESHGGHGGEGHAGHGGEAHDGEAEAATRARFSFPDGPPSPGAAAALTIDVLDEAGKRVERFVENHEKLMHLIVVSEDLSHFEHLHPARDEEHSFRADVVFPAAGKYKLFADYVPEGGAQTTAGAWIETSGAAADEPASPPPAAPDEVLVKTLDGVEVSLAAEGLAPGGTAALTFSFRDAATGRPIAGLEPYLGAAGHVVILSEDAETYLHVHPSEEAGTGAEAAFHTSFPAEGIYKIWGQFQYQGTIITAPFVVRIE